MGFVQRLSRQPVVVEVIPPRAGAPAKQVEQALGVVDELLDHCRVDAVNVPEILGSAFQGMDPVEFGLLVRQRHDLAVVVNKVVVHEPAEAFRTWFDRVLGSELASAVLVGGERSGIYYPGPTVIEADRAARVQAEAAGRPDFPIGNITIPSRPREAASMQAKIKAGCDYFTSQIIYESPSANAHLQAYDDVCALAGIPARPVLYAFSPAANAQDVRFLRYLGVHIPPDVERTILGAGSDGARVGARIIQDAWTGLLSAASGRRVTVPLGLIVETVSRHNVDATAQLVQSLRQALEQSPAAAPAAPVKVRP